MTTKNNLTETILSEMGFEKKEHSSNPTYYKNVALNHNHLFEHNPPYIANYKDEWYIGYFCQDTFYKVAQIYDLQSFIYRLVEMSVERGEDNLANKLKELIIRK